MTVLRYFDIGAVPIAAQQTTLDHLCDVCQHADIQYVGYEKDRDNMGVFAIYRYKVPEPVQFLYYAVPMKS